MITDRADSIDSAALEASIARAADRLIAEQRADGHWLYRLEADATIPAEYILLRAFLGEPADDALEAKLATYLRRRQSPAHDGWPLYHGGGFNISASVKAYFALKMVGDDAQAPHMARARAAILAAGGAEAVNVFTRIQLALFGAHDSTKPWAADPWAAVPVIPPELILAPRWFPVHLTKMSYWARTVVVPLLVLCAMKPVAQNPRGVLVPELYTGKPAKLTSQAAHVSQGWRWFFGALDALLKRGNQLWPKALRARAIALCEAWVLERLNGEDGLGAIYPAMANSVMMFAALGYAPDHPARRIARHSIDKLLAIDADEATCQPCVSPVWDTALAAHTLLEVGGAAATHAADQALDWLCERQVLDVAGDWADQRPAVQPGGWAFQYANPHYPDLDDTAVVVMALDKARGSRAADQDAEAIARAVAWTVGLQSCDRRGHLTGWGAFDADNDKFYLNNLPFADHGALLDPPTADVTARVVAMLAQLGEGTQSPRPYSATMAAALAWLEREQAPDGSWFGRWGVNYIYGTWSVLGALGRAGLAADHPMVAKAVAWLKAIQNPDGGWGESCDSYALTRTGHQPFPSVASQTAWACLGLMAVGEVASPAVAQGLAWLAANQGADGLWSEEAYTGGGFPRVFYLRYHGYARYFPLWALARYRNLMASNTARPSWGM